MWYLKRARVAPRLERKLFLDGTCEAAGPLKPRECGDGRFHEGCAEQICTQTNVICGERLMRYGLRFKRNLPIIVASWSTCPTAVMFPPFTKMSWCRMIAYHLLQYRRFVQTHMQLTSQMASARSSSPPCSRMNSRATIAPLNSKLIFVVARYRSAVPMSWKRQLR
jgi:hypothetical protein